MSSLFYAIVRRKERRICQAETWTKLFIKISSRSRFPYVVHVLPVCPEDNRTRWRTRGFSRRHGPPLGVRVPERVTWRIPHGRLIPRGPPYIIQISYANSLINNAGTERFIIPRYHRRLNTADLHANSSKDGISRSPFSLSSSFFFSVSLPPRRGTCPARSIRNGERNASERLSHVALCERAPGNGRLFLVTGVDVTKLPENTPRNLAIF